MKTCWIAFLSLFISLTVCLGDFNAAQRAMIDYDRSLAKWQERFASATDDDTKKVLQQARPNPRRTTQTILKAVGRQLDEANAMRAIAWIYKNDSGYLKQSNAIDVSNAIRSALERKHFSRPGAGNLAITVSRNFSTPDLPFLEKVAKLSPSPEDRGLASLAVSIALSQVGDDPAIIGKRLSHLRTAIKLTPDEAQIDGKKVTDIISDQLYFIQHLTKGRKAPNFNGTSIAGSPVNLNVAAGKVAVLVFWSDADGVQDNWIASLQNMQSVCTKHGAEMIGIYTGNPELLRNQIADRTVTWRNAYDHSGAITEQYRISRTPTAFLLDKEGKIQAVGEPNSIITLSIEALSN